MRGLLDMSGLKPKLLKTSQVLGSHSNSHSAISLSFSSDGSELTLFIGRAQNMNCK